MIVIIFVIETPPCYHSVFLLWHFFLLWYLSFPTIGLRVKSAFPDASVGGTCQTESLLSAGRWCLLSAHQICLVKSSRTWLRMRKSGHLRVRMAGMVVWWSLILGCMSRGLDVQSVAKPSNLTYCSMQSQYQLTTCWLHRKHIYWLAESTGITWNYYTLMILLYIFKNPLIYVIAYPRIHGELETWGRQQGDLDRFCILSRRTVELKPCIRHTCKPFIILPGSKHSSIYKRTQLLR